MKISLFQKVDSLLSSEKIKTFLFYTCLAMASFGLIQKVRRLPTGPPLALFGFLGLLIFFSIRFIKGIGQSKKVSAIILLPILFVLMCITLFLKYFHHAFWDYPAYAILPVFIIYAVILLSTGAITNRKLFVATIVFLLMSAPLFDLSWKKGPRKFIASDPPRYDISGSIAMRLSPGRFKYWETHYLDSIGTGLNKTGDYNAAIKVFEKARQLEPRNPYIFFDMSASYAMLDQLEKAMVYMDTAIKMNDTISMFFNNRGLLHYKLVQNIDAMADYNKAISLDPGNAVIYNNLALVYFYEHEDGQACSLFDKAKLLGLPGSEIAKEKDDLGLICK